MSDTGFRKSSKASLLALGTVLCVILAGCSILPLKPVDPAPARTDILGPDRYGNIVTSPSERANFTVVPVEGQPFSLAVRVENLVEVGQSHQIQFSMRNKARIEEGDLVAVSFYYRGIDTTKPDGTITLGYTFEARSGDPKVIPVTPLSVPADGTWHLVEIPVISTRTFEIDEAQLAFRTGYHLQTVEVGGIQFFNFGKLR